jgi:hypothetical protein
MSHSHVRVAVGAFYRRHSALFDAVDIDPFEQVPGPRDVRFQGSVVNQAGHLVNQPPEPFVVIR